MRDASRNTSIGRGEVKATTTTSKGDGSWVGPRENETKATKLTLYQENAAAILLHVGERRNSQLLVQSQRFLGYFTNHLQYWFAHSIHQNIWGLQHMVYKETQRKLGFFSLEESWQRGRLAATAAASQRLQRRKRGSWRHTGMEMRFRAQTRTVRGHNCSCARNRPRSQAQGGCGAASPGDMQSWPRSEQHVVLEVSRHPFQPKWFCNSTHRHFWPVTAFWGTKISA